MVLQLSYSSTPQTTLRLSPYQSIDEVCCLIAPTLRDFAILELNILGEHEVSDLISGSAIVGPFASHEFIGNDSDCKVVRDKGVVHPADDLWS